MLDREYEQQLQNSGSAIVDKEKSHILWLITASAIIVPAILYISKIS